MDSDDSFIQQVRESYSKKMNQRSSQSAKFKMSGIVDNRVRLKPKKTLNPVGPETIIPEGY